jgi:excisionase family DNA binding protein
MAALSLGQAAQQVGISKSTIVRAVRKGRLSATRTPDGGYLIDPAELFRVYPPGGAEQRGVAHHATTADGGVATELRIRNAEMASEITALRQILENERRRAEEIRVERDEWRAQAQQAQRLLTYQQARPGLLGRLLRRTG